MSGLLESCRDIFGTDDLYKILNVNENAATKIIKKAYYKLSLQVHPDKVPTKEREKATKKFQALGKVYTVLSDKDKRDLYNESGEVDEEGGLSEDKNWYDYWRLLFSKISVNDVQQFSDNYKGSDEELKDLKAAYLDCEGDMDAILDTIFCTTIDDEARFAAIIKNLIKKKELPDFSSFSKESSTNKRERNEKFAEEAAEAEKAAKKMKLDDMGDLTALIRSRQESRASAADSFFDQLQAKYAEPEKKSKSETKSRAGKTEKKKTKKSQSKTSSSQRKSKR